MLGAPRRRRQEQIDDPSSRQAGVKPPTAARLAWSLGAGCVAGTLGGIVLAILNGHSRLEDAAAAVALLSYPVVGALIAARQPGNLVGWVLCAAGVCSTLGLASDAYADYALVTAPGSLPGGLWVAWAGTLWFAPFFMLVVVLLPLVFPTGRLLSPRWRLVAWSGLAFMLLTMIGNGLQPDAVTVSGLGVIQNPVGVPTAWTPWLDGLINLGALLLVPSIAGAVAAVVVRFRRARGVERQQLKWCSYAAALLPVPFIVGDLPQLGIDVPPMLFEVLFILVLPLLPLSVGIAIGRYRLYEIDRIINRTLVYGLLTALLGGVYAGVVLVLGQLFGGIGGEPPSWVVAGATLAVAALFQPARRRIQAAVDRRFNRRRYDVARTIEAFSARLRDEVDLDTLCAELLAVVDQTMEPTRASLWLRPPADRSWRPSPG
jgi:hypothetical protein